MTSSFTMRSRWAAVGAAVAVTLGTGGIGITQALTESGEKSIYTPIEPCRVADTRPAPDTVGSRSTALGPDETYTLGANGGNCGTVPTTATGLSLNVTAIGPTLPTFLAVFPAGGAVPATSNLNPVPGQPPTPNAVNVALEGGEFSIYNLQGNVNVIVDIVGFYDDHNHDDRYYTKEQVDNAIAAGGGGGDPIYTQDEVDDLLDEHQSFAVVSPLTPDPGSVALGNTAAPAQIVASVTVDAPVAGQATVNYSTYVVPTNAAGARVGCSVGTGTDIDFDTSGSTVGEGFRFTLGGTAVLDVAQGSTTFNVVCDKLNDGNTGNASAAHPTLTAIFTPAAP